MAAGSPPRPAALHPDLLLMDKPGRAVVRRTATALPGPRRVLLPRRAHHRTGRLDHDLERHRPALQVDQDRRPDHRPHLQLLLTHLRTGTLAEVRRDRSISVYIQVWTAARSAPGWEEPYSSQDLRLLAIELLRGDDLRSEEHTSE